MMPRPPPWLVARSDHDKVPEHMASGQGPAGEEFNQVVSIALGLGEALWNVGVIIFFAGAIAREVSRGNHWRAVEVQIDAVHIMALNCECGGRLVGLHYRTVHS